MRSGVVVLLNGCSSSGKTSLAHALQRAAPDLQFVHVGLDAFRAMEPPGYWDPERKALWPARVAALCHAINTTTREFTRHGQNVVLDHVLSEEAWHHLEEDLGDEPMHLVRVECPLALAEAREAARADRTPGLARSQWASMHAGRRYDVCVDTSEVDADEGARIVLAWLRGNPRPATLAERSAGLHAA